MGFLTEESGDVFSPRVLKGGPLGEMVQWADILTALHVLGHNLKISISLKELHGWVKVWLIPLWSCYFLILLSSWRQNCRSQCTIHSSVRWYSSHPNLMWDCVGHAGRSHLLFYENTNHKTFSFVAFFHAMKMLRCSLSLGALQMINSPIGVFFFFFFPLSPTHCFRSPLATHADKLSLLPAECHFSLRAWQHLYSLCTSFLLQPTDSRVITALSLVITNISPHTHTHTCAFKLHRRDGFIYKY